MAMTIPSIRFVQKKVTMYLVALPIAELDQCRIDHWDPKKIGKWKGYQRGLIKRKINNLAEYLERPDAILPVAGLLNVREKNTLEFKGEISKHPTAGTLRIPEGTQLWVVDMQHRLEGIRQAHSKGHLKEFAVPVLITEGLNNIGEAAQFYIINTQAKRMGVDLTRRLLIEHNEIKTLTDVPEWELKAVQIAIHLNKKIKANNPWYGRIREPESERMRDNIATEKSFVPSLKWLFDSEGINKKSYKYLARFLSNYWEGIRYNLPSAFESPRSYLIQKTPGFMAFHRLAPLIYRKYKKRNLTTYKNVFKVFKDDRKYGENFWYNKNLNGAKKYGTGQGAYTNLAIDLAQKLGLS